MRSVQASFPGVSPGIQGFTPRAPATQSFMPHPGTQSFSPTPTPGYGYAAPWSPGQWSPGPSKPSGDVSCTNTIANGVVTNEICCSYPQPDGTVMKHCSGDVNAPIGKGQGNKPGSDQDIIARTNAIYNEIARHFGLPSSHEISRRVHAEAARMWLQVRDRVIQGTAGSLLDSPRENRRAAVAQNPIFASGFAGWPYQIAQQAPSQQCPPGYSSFFCPRRLRWVCEPQQSVMRTGTMVTR